MKGSFHLGMQGRTRIENHSSTLKQLSINVRFSIPSYEIELDDSLRRKVKTIIFSEGIQATGIFCYMFLVFFKFKYDSQILDFAKSHIVLSSYEPIGKLVKKTQSDKSDIEIWGLQYRDPEPSLFFLINQETLLCICSPALTSEDCYPFAKSVRI